MVAKRALVFDDGKPTPAKNAKRIKALAVKVSQNKGELKYYVGNHVSAVANNDAAIIDLTSIAQGSDYNQRDGNEVRIKSVSLVGYLGGPKVDLFLIQAKNASLITAANFTNCVGGEMTYSTFKSAFVQWLHYLPMDGVGNVNYRRSFSHGIKAEYNGSTSTACNRNRLFAVISNNSGASITPSMYFKVEYYD